MVAVLAAATLVAFSPPGGYFIIIVLGFWVWLVVGLTWLGRFIGNVAVQRPIGIRGWTTWLVAPVIVLVSAGAIHQDIPLVLRFRISEPAMTRFAKHTLVEPTGNPPDRVGLYKVGRVEMLDGGVGFTVAGAGIVDESGFAYSPQGPPAEGGGNSYEHLGGDWYLWEQDF